MGGWSVGEIGEGVVPREEAVEVGRWVEEEEEEEEERRETRAASAS